MEIRALRAGDLPALERLLAPTEQRSLFLVGNAQSQGFEDRGEGLQGVWAGAFDGGELVGVCAFFRGPGSLAPACEGHAAALVPLVLERVGRPRLVVGTAARVEEALAHLGSGPAHRAREKLLALRWPLYEPRRGEAVRPLASGEAEAAAALIGALHEEAGLPTDPAVNLATARRQAAAGAIQSLWEGERLVAMSTAATTTGRWVHVGATYCAPDARRRGAAAACVSAVLDRAREAGQASVGAALFTGVENVPALRLYEGLGFEADVDWEIAFL